MGKDPAFLFYSSDFLTGTMLFTDEQVGKYIRLLCYQHQNGHMQEKHMLSICKAYDEDIFTKFVRDKDGLYYNQRLETEIAKRANYTESRRANASKAKDKKKSDGNSRTYGKHMQQHMENENENEIKNTGTDLDDCENSTLYEDNDGKSLLVEKANDEPKQGNPSLTRKPRERKKTGVFSMEQQNRFEIFWQAYPNKKSPGQAEATFAKINPDDGMLQEILVGIERAKKYDHRFREVRYTPFPSSWLNSKGWKDLFDEGGDTGGEHRQHIGGVDGQSFTPSTGFRNKGN